MGRAVVNPWQKQFYSTPDAVSIGELHARVKYYDVGGIHYFYIMNPNSKYCEKANLSWICFTSIEAAEVLKFVKPILKKIESGKNKKLLDIFNGSTEIAEMKREDPKFWENTKTCLLLNSVRIRVSQKTHDYNTILTLHRPQKNDKKGHFIVIRQQEIVQVVEFLEKQLGELKN